MNKAFLSGMIMDTSALRMEADEVPHLTFGLSVRHRTRAGELRSEIYSINAWRNVAKWGSEKLSRGQIVCIQGYLTQRKLTGEGEPAFVTEVTIEEFLPARGAQMNEAGAEPAQAG